MPSIDYNIILQQKMGIMLLFISLFLSSFRQVNLNQLMQNKENNLLLNSWLVWLKTINWKLENWLWCDCVTIEKLFVLTCTEAEDAKGQQWKSNKWPHSQIESGRTWTQNNWHLKLKKSACTSTHWKASSVWRMEKTKIKTKWNARISASKVETRGQWKSNCRSVSTKFPLIKYC